MVQKSQGDHHRWDGAKTLQIMGKKLPTYQLVSEFTGFLVAIITVPSINRVCSHCFFFPPKMCALTNVDGINFALSRWIQSKALSTENHLSKQALHLLGMYAPWKVDGATPNLLFATELGSDDRNLLSQGCGVIKLSKKLKTQLPPLLPGRSTQKGKQNVTVQDGPLHIIPTFSFTRPFIRAP